MTALAATGDSNLFGVILGACVLLGVGAWELYAEYRRNRPRRFAEHSSMAIPTAPRKPPGDVRPVIASSPGLPARADPDDEGWALLVEVRGPPVPGGEQAIPALMIEPMPAGIQKRPTGEPRFDRRYLVMASDAVFARVGGNARSAFIASEPTWTLRNGRLETQLRGHHQSTARLNELLAEGQAIGAALLATLDTSAAALLAAFDDRSWRMRAAALQALLDRYPQSAELVSAFERVETDPSPRLRVFALALAHDVERLIEATRQHDRGGRSEAFEALLRIAPADPRLGPLLEVALLDRMGLDDEHAQWVMETIEERPDELQKLVSHEVLQRFLLHFVESEDTLQAELARRVLGGFGDGVALAELNRRVDESRHKEALLGVVFKIRERLGDGSVGGLALTGGGGELTLQPLAAHDAARPHEAEPTP